MRGRERGRHLAADVAAADQHGALGLLGVGADRVGVAERAQVVDAVEVAALRAQPAHVRAGGEQRVVELDLVLGRQRGHALVAVELHHAGAGEQLDVLLAPPLVGAEQHVLPGLLALQVALGQRRPVVGRVELAAHQQHAALGRPPRAASARSWRRRGRRRSAGGRPCGGHRLRGRARPSGPRSARSRSPRARRRAPAAPRRRPARPSRRWARSRRRRAGSRSRASRRAGRGP